MNGHEDGLKANGQMDGVRTGGKTDRQTNSISEMLLIVRDTATTVPLQSPWHDVAPI